MKRVQKDVRILLISLIIVISLVLVINVFSSVLADVSQDEQEKIPQVYKWLVNHTKNKWNTLNLKQDAFSLLALQCNSTWVSQGNKSLYNLSYYNSTQKIRCWKEQGKATNKNDCRLTETALAKLALNEIDVNTTYVDNWLLQQNRTFVKGVYWFLEIDVARGREASCEIMYGDIMQNVTIHADKTVSVKPSTVGNCIMNQPFRQYWFQINPTETCYSYEYTIKCFGNESGAEPVLSTLLYRNNTNDPKTSFFVSSEISQGTLGFINEVGEEDPSPGLMQLSVPSYCLADPKDPAGECDYEGTAWAAYVWQREGNLDYANKYTPYLVIYSGFNEKYFPESFLSTLVGSDYTTQLITEQQRLRKPQSKDYWSFWLNQPLWYGQFYDTPKAVLALGEYTSNILEVKDYLLGHLARDYSWINTFDAAPNKDTHRDTAFILWVFWQSYCPGAEQYGENACESQGLDFFCREGNTCIDFEPFTIYTCPEGTVCCKNATMNPDACIEAGGECRNETQCPSGSGFLENIFSCPDQSICCKDYSTNSCYDFGGSFCDEYAGETCPENESRMTLDGNCCLTACLPKNTSEESCFSLGGAECKSGQICWSFILEEEIPFIPALDDNCCTADCVKDASCSEAGGKDCSYFGSEYRCVDSMGNSGTEIKTTDVSNCCMADCKRPCASEKVCSSSSQCSQIDSTAMAPANGVCCATACKTKKSLLWLVILIIVIVLAVLVYFFVFRKKKNKTEEENIDEFSDFSNKPTKKSEMSLFQPFKPKPKQGKDIKEKTAESEEPFGDLPADFEEIEEKPEKSKKGKSKAETELEETLGKLKKMTKR